MNTDIGAEVIFQLTGLRRRRLGHPNVRLWQIVLIKSWSCVTAKNSQNFILLAAYH